VTLASALFLILLLAPRYEARLMTYGCNSSSAVAELEKVRAEPQAFQKLLLTRIAYGDCIGIGKGTVVEGAVEQGDRSVLRIEARNSPPGYMAPLADFRPL
jgi:hypothetical protein